MERPGSAGLFSFMQYMWPFIAPGERFEVTPHMAILGEVVGSKRTPK
jgi:hypothetical protein